MATESTIAFSDFLMSSITEPETTFITSSIQTTQENSRNVDTMDMFSFNVSQQQANMGSSSYAQSHPMKTNGIGAINLSTDAGTSSNRGVFFGHETQGVPNNNTNGYVQFPVFSNRQMPRQNYDGHMQTRSPNTGDGANITHSPCTPNPRQDYPITPPGNMNPQSLHLKSAAIPALTEYPGANEFEIYFGESTESAVKSAEYTHSLSLGKLFVKMNVPCPIQFRCSNDPPKGSVIRAMPVYIRSEHVTEVVSRCPNHQIQDPNQALSRHLIRAEKQGHEAAKYETNQDGRESVMVPYRSPEVGARYITVLYRFMCLSSCVGGINRRPIITVFTLESPDGVVLGRRFVEVRVCSCPGRDRTQEEKRKRKKTEGYPDMLPKKKKPLISLQESASDGNQEEFFLRVRGKEKYLILKKIKEALDLKEMISPHLEEEYRRRERNDGDLALRGMLNNCLKQCREKKQEEKEILPFPT